MSRRQKDSDVVFSSEKFENRIRLTRLLLPVGIVVLVIGLAIAAAFIVRASQGMKYTGGEDTPYPYSWRNSRKGVMTLEIARSEDPEKTWLLLNPDPININAEEAKKQPKETVRYTVTPGETGRHTLSFFLMEGEEAAAKMDLLLETTVSEKGSLTTEVVSSSILERQTPENGGDNTYFPYTFSTDANSFLVITISNSTEVEVADWECVSEDENAAQFGGVLYTENGAEVYIIPGGTEGTSKVTVSSELAAAVIRLDIERTSAGTLLVRSHSMEGGTSIPEPPVYPEEYDQPEEGQTEAAADEQPAN